MALFNMQRVVDVFFFSHDEIRRDASAQFQFKMAMIESSAFFVYSFAQLKHKQNESRGV